jgi:hypothetical protein
MPWKRNWGKLVNSQFDYKEVVGKLEAVGVNDGK